MAVGRSSRRRTREISLTEHCVLLGNKPWRNAVSVPEKGDVDTVWRSTPETVWMEVIGSLRSGFFYQPHGRSVDEGEFDSDTYGFKFDEEAEPAESDVMYRYWPDVAFGGETEYEAREEKKEELVWKRVEPNYRVGTSRGRRGNSHQPIMELIEARRVTNHR